MGIWNTHRGVKDGSFICDAITLNPKFGLLNWIDAPEEFGLIYPK
jgi:hypothetical protein